MDIDYVLRSFEIPRDSPGWEVALLARLHGEPGAEDVISKSSPRTDLDSGRGAVILPFKRPAAA